MLPPFLVFLDSVRGSSRTEMNVARPLLPHQQGLFFATLGQLELRVNTLAGVLQS
jgi:hypothetical protein